MEGGLRHTQLERTRRLLKWWAGRQEADQNPQKVQAINYITNANTFTNIIIVHIKHKQHIGEQSSSSSESSPYGCSLAESRQHLVPSSSRFLNFELTRLPPLLRRRPDGGAGAACGRRWWEVGASWEEEPVGAAVGASCVVGGGGSRQKDRRGAKKRAIRRFEPLTIEWPRIVSSHCTMGHKLKKIEHLWITTLCCWRRWERTHWRLGPQAAWGPSRQWVRSPWSYRYGHCRHAPSL